MQPKLKAYDYPAYGIVSLGKVGVEVMLQLYLFDFYTRILGLSPLLAGIAFAIAIFWDALSDIVVALGLFKARKIGIQYTTVILIGGMILALASSVLFADLATNNQPLLFSQLLIAYVLVNTGMTLIDLPQSSLCADLSKDPNQRNTLFGWRLGFGIIGLAIGSALPGILLKADDSAALIASRSDGANNLAVIVMITAAITTFIIRPREKAAHYATAFEVPSLAEAKNLLKDAAFRNILIASVIAAIGRTINSALALMYYRFVLKLSEEQVTQIIFPVFTLSILFSIPLWVQLSKRYGKAKPAWLAVAGLGLMGILAYPTLPSEKLIPALIVSCIGGILCGAVFLVDSMITDLIDLDAQKTGKRKESLYFAVWKSGVKISRAIAFVVIGFSLDVASLELSLNTVSQSTEWVIIGLFGILVGICFVLSGLYLRRVNIK